MININRCGNMHYYFAIMPRGMKDYEFAAVKVNEIQIGNYWDLTEC